MSAQLMVAYPDIFHGAGLLNGGLPGTGPRMLEYITMPYMQDEALEAAKAEAWGKT